MISVRQQEGYGNDSHCTILLNGESIVTNKNFSNPAKGRANDELFTLIGEDHLPIRSTTHKYGNHSWYFDGVNQNTLRGIVMRAMVNKTYENWNFGKNDFAIEFTLMSVSTGNTTPINLMSLYQDNDNYHRIEIIANDDGIHRPSARVYWNIRIGGEEIVNFNRIMEVNYNTNQWYHVAFVRKTERVGFNEYDNFTIFGHGGIEANVYGLSGITNEFITDIPHFSNDLLIGITPGDIPSTLTNMYIDDFRISKGHCRWDGQGEFPSKRFRPHNRGY